MIFSISLVHLGYQAGVLCHPLHLLLSWLSPSALVHLGYQAGVLCHPLHLLLSWLSPSALVHLGYQAGVLCHPLHLLLSWLSPSSLVHLGYQAGVLCHPLHLLLSWLSPSSKPHFFMSCLILSIHLILGLPSPRVPLTSSFIVSFTLFPSSICRMCPYQRNLACNVMFSTMKSNGSTMPTEFCQTHSQKCCPTRSNSGTGRFDAATVCV